MQYPVSVLVVLGTDSSRALLISASVLGLAYRVGWLELSHMRIGTASGRRVGSHSPTEVVVVAVVGVSGARRLWRTVESSEQKPHSCQGVPRQKGRSQNWFSSRRRPLEGPASHCLCASLALSGRSLFQF